MSETQQTAGGKGFNAFLPFFKIDKDRRIVSGYASTPTQDSDGEIVNLEAVRKALPKYMRYGNIREMHKLSAVGVAEDAAVDSKGLYLEAKIVDDGAWKKCLEGVYKGFSIGGRKLDMEGNEITELDLTEISIVDRPSNPDCDFKLAKGEKNLNGAGGYLVKLEKPSMEEKAIRKMAEAVALLSKAKDPPAAQDGMSLPAKQKAGDVTDPPDVNPPDPTTKSAEEPYGDVEYADPGHQADGKKRYPIDTAEHIRAAWNYINKPKNAAKYSSADAAKIKARIVSAWKSKIDKDGPPSAKESETSKAFAPPPELSGSDFLTLNKRMSSVGDLSYAFDTLRRVQRSLLVEGRAEGNDGEDKALATRLGTVARDLAEIMSLKALHEGKEALTLTDADDKFLSTQLREDFAMTLKAQGADLNDDNDDGEVNLLPSIDALGGSDPLTNAVAAMLKRAAMPTKAQRLSCAQDNVKKSRKACKTAREAIEEAHKLHKAAYLAKMAKASKAKPKEEKDDEDEFDHVGAMEKLAKAYQEIEKARTFAKAADEQIKKSATSRTGQRGQETTDAEAGVYEVPPGVKPLTQSDLVNAGPGGNERGTEAPELMSDRVFPGKSALTADLAKMARNGQVPVALAQLALEKAQLEGELAALRRMPAGPSNGQRPFSFDVTKAFGSGAGNLQKANASLFDGVNVNAIGSGDERAHTEAAARVIGNLLTAGPFSKSVFDPAFKGAAGSH